MAVDLSIIEASCKLLLFQFIEKALEECGNDFDLATKYLLNLPAQSAKCDAAPGYQPPNGMTTEDQVPAEGNLLMSSAIILVMSDNYPFCLCNFFLKLYTLYHLFVLLQTLICLAFVCYTFDMFGT
jgi:hypothetical protein